MTRWPNIQPGDIGFDKGVGISGFLIRFGTRSPYAHCWVYHHKLSGNRWATVEAGPKDGVIWRIREVEPNLVVRLWESHNQQQAILSRSAELVGAKYGWGEIARICLYLVGIKLRTRKDNPNRVICSNHVAQAAVAGVPTFRQVLRYPTYSIWPGALAEDLKAFEWAREHAWKRISLI